MQKARLDQDKSPELGRKFIAANVDYMHYTVNLYELASGAKRDPDDKQPRYSCDADE